jgi:hypothetical protein
VPENVLIERARKDAFNSAVSSINLSSRLPDQVFVESGAEFLFFESDQLFAPSFVEVAHEFMSVEGSTSCCLLNFSRTSVMDYCEVAAIFLETSMTGTEYDARLRSGGPAEGWLFDGDRYGCASDGGCWSIYCEKDNDVAVVALRGQGGAGRFAPPLRLLHAEAIDILTRLRLRPTRHESVWLAPCLVGLRRGLVSFSHVVTFA